MGLFEDAQKDVANIVAQYKTGPALSSGEDTAGPSLFELAKQDVDQIVNAPVSRSAVGEIATAFERGTVSGVPKAGGQTAQYLGRQLNMPSITDVGKSLEEIGIEQGMRKDLQPSADLAERPVVRTLAGVSESLPLSIVPVAAGAVGTAMGGPIVGGAVAASTALPLFGGSSAEETRRKVLAADKPEAEAESAAGKVFWVQGSLDTAQTLLSGALMRVLGKPVLGAGALTAKEVLTKVANPKHLKTFAKELGKIATAEAATEAGQDVTTQMIEERAGVKSYRTLAETGTESAIGGVLMASFFGALGIPIRIAQANQHTRLLSALSDPKTSLGRRTAAAEAIGEQIEKVDPEKAKNWRENAAVAIDNRIPIELNGSFLGSARDLKDRIQGFSMRGEPYGGPSSPYRTPYPRPEMPSLLPPGEGSAAFGQSSFGPGPSQVAESLPSITDIPISRASDITEGELEGEVLTSVRPELGAPAIPGMVEGTAAQVTEQLPGMVRKGLPAPEQKVLPTEKAGRDLADSMGLRFEGIQEDAYGNPAFYVITDPETKSTLFFSPKDTRDDIRKRLDTSRKLFAKTREQETDTQAKRAADFQRELKDQIAAVSGASKRPEAARKLGVDVKDPESVRAKIVELKAEAARWENWPAHPDLVAKVREVPNAEAVRSDEGQIRQGSAEGQPGIQPGAVESGGDLQLDAEEKQKSSIDTGQAEIDVNLIPDDMEVSVTVIREKNGGKYQVKENAKNAMADNMAAMETYKSILECLAL